MSPVYIARATAVAARVLDGEMMIMSATGLDAVHPEPDRDHHLAVG